MMRSFVLAVAAFALAAPGSSAAAVVAAPNPVDAAFDELARIPQVAPDQFRGSGARAIRQGRDLYVLDGEGPAAGAFRRVEHGATIRGMAWSHDGRWLAYATDGALWLAGRRTLRPRRLPLVIAAGDSFEWSPRADVLCVIHRTGESSLPPIDPSFGYPGPAARRLFPTGIATLVTPDRGARVQPTRALPEPLHWTGNGRELAAYAYRAILPYAQWPQARFALFVVRAARETLRTRSVPGGQLAFAAPVPDTDDVLSWRGSILSGSAAADGQELWLSPARGVERKLGTMLENPSWIAFSRDAKRFVFVQGPGREAWHAKSLALCTVAQGRCRPLPQPASSIAIDPRWSPDGSRIAFVHAVDHGAGGGYGERNLLANWIGRRTLWLQNADTEASHPVVPFGSGVFWPQWSRDGRRVLLYRNGQIWIGAPGGSPPKRVVDGLARPDEFPAHFSFNHGMANEDDSPVAWTGR